MFEISLVLNVVMKRFGE